MKKIIDQGKIVKEMQSLLRIKLKYFREFHDVSTQQKQAVQSQKNSEMEALLLKKDSIISKIMEFEKQIESLIKKTPSTESELVEDNMVKSLNQNIKELIDKIVKTEKEVTDLLQKKEDRAKKDFSTLRKGKTLVAGYGGKKLVRPRFVDYKIH